jgi:hypothetical protein
MGRPHAHLDRPRSPAEAARIARGLTLDRAVMLGGGRLSRSMWHVLERTGRGSAQAWQVVSEVLGLSVEALRPPRETGALAPQLSLLPASSS